MSELLQSGHHPDADQLNAFVEHALPAHESDETLAHLAICADCRAVVAMSLPPVEETLPQPVPARRHWSLGRRYLWPITATAVLALFVAATVHMRNVAIAPIASIPPQIAVSRTPPPPTPPSGASVPNAQELPAAKGHATSHAFAAKREKSPVVSDLPLQRRDLAPTPVAGSAPEIGAASGGVVSTNGAAIALDQNAASRAQPQSQPLNLNLFQTPSQSATVSNYSPSLAPPVAASDTAPPSVALLQSKTVPLAFAVSNLALAVLRSHPLPSGLPALSIVTNALRNQTLAVDIHGALFLTADSGEHWTSVAAPWPGRAVKVDLAYSGSIQGANILGPMSMKHVPQLAPATRSIRGPVTISSGAVLSSLSGTVTDAGGATIPGATVIVSTSPTQLARMAKTDAAGRYVVEDLAPGTYSVEADVPGFSRQQITGVSVTPGKTSTADLTLAVAATTQTVNVTTAAAQLELDEPETKVKTTAPAMAAAPAQPVFEVTTDSGQQWVSTDGLSWKPKTNQK